jgi:hypothetical protein
LEGEEGWEGVVWWEGKGGGICFGRHILV